MGIGVRCVTCGSEARGDEPRDVETFIAHHHGGQCRSEDANPPEGPRRRELVVRLTPRENPSRS
jgi:hypothetical protein